MMGPKECHDCYTKRTTLEGDRAKAEARRKAHTAAQEAFDEEFGQVAATVQSGAESYLYRSVYLPVDSIHGTESVVEAFDIDPIRGLGRTGWEVVGVVPRTIGTPLENISIGSMSGKTWGGAISGTVIGVHVLLRYRVTTANIHAAAEVLTADTGLAEFVESPLHASA